MSIGWWLLITMVQGLWDDQAKTWRLPMAENGERCPWPFDPPALYGQPIGMYHCPYCGSMVVAGMPHPDYSRIVDGERLP